MHSSENNSENNPPPPQPQRRSSLPTSSSTAVTKEDKKSTGKNNNNNNNDDQQQQPQPVIAQVIRGKHLRAIDMLDSRTWTELEIIAGWHNDKDSILNDAVSRLDKIDEAVKKFSARIKKVDKKLNDNEEMFLRYSKEGERLFRSATAFGLRLGNFIDPHSPDHRIAERVLLIALDMTDPKHGPLKFEQQFNLRLRAVALNNLATVLAQAKRFVEAVEKVQMARAIEAELGPAAESPATTMFNEAQIYYLAGRTVEALQAFHQTSQVLRMHFEKSLGNKEKATNGGLLLAALRQLAGICEATHRYQDAIMTLEDALELARRVEKVTLHMHNNKNNNDQQQQQQPKASDVVARDHAGRKMTAVREAISADLKRCQTALDRARKRPRSRLQPLDLPKPLTFEEEAIQKKQQAEMRKMKFGERGAEVASHHDWFHSPAVLGGNVSCVAEAETLKLTKRSSSSPGRRGTKTIDNDDDPSSAKARAEQDRALARVLAPVSQNTTSSRNHSQKKTKSHHHSTTVVDEQTERIFSEDYKIKTEVPVPVSSIDDLVKSLPKSLQSAYKELQMKGVEAHVISKEAAPPKAKSHRPALASQFSFTSEDTTSTSRPAATAADRPFTTRSSNSSPSPSAAAAFLPNINTSTRPATASATTSRGDTNSNNIPTLVVRPPKKIQGFGGLSALGGRSTSSAAARRSSPGGVDLKALVDAATSSHEAATKSTSTGGGDSKSLSPAALRKKSDEEQQQQQQVKEEKVTRPQSAPTLPTSKSEEQQQQQQQQEKVILSSPEIHHRPDHAKAQSPQELFQTPSPPPVTKKNTTEEQQQPLPEQRRSMTPTFQDQLEEHEKEQQDANNKTKEEKEESKPEPAASISASSSSGVILDPALSSTARIPTPPSMMMNTSSLSATGDATHQQSNNSNNNTLTSSATGNASGIFGSSTMAMTNTNTNNTTPNLTPTPHVSPRPTNPSSTSIRSLGGSRTSFVVAPPHHPPPNAASASYRRNSSSLQHISRNNSATFGSSSPLSANFSATVNQNSSTHFSPFSTGGAKSTRGKPRSYNPKSVDDILNQTFAGGGGGAGSPGASRRTLDRSVVSGKEARRKSEMFQLQIQNAAEELARKWREEEEDRKSREESKKRNRFSKNYIATIVSRFLLARPCRVMVIEKQDEFLEKQVRFLVADQRRSAILLAREEMQNTAMARAATDFVNVWSTMHLNRTSRSPQMKSAADKAEEVLLQRQQSRDTFLGKAKQVMERLEKTELALTAKSIQHAEFLRRDTVTKFLKQSEGVRIMQALLRGVASLEVRAHHEHRALTVELAHVREYNFRVATATRIQRWFRRRLSSELKRKVARERRQARLQELEEYQLLFSSSLRYRESVNVTYNKKISRLNMCLMKFGAIIRGFCLRQRLPWIRWDHARYVERKRLQSALIIQHIWVFHKLLTEFINPFQGLSVEDVDNGRREFAAIRIQSRYRAHLYGRPWMKQLYALRQKKAEEWHVFIAVVSIQRWWHRAKANTQLRRLKKQELEFKNAYMDHALRRWAGNVVLKFLKWASKLRRDQAITMWEAEAAKQKYIASQEMRVRICATKIQRAWREYYNYKCRVVAAFDANPPFELFLGVDDDRGRFCENSSSGANEIITTRLDVLREANLTRQIRENHSALIRSLEIRKATSEKRRRLSEQNTLMSLATADVSTQQQQQQQQQENTCETTTTTTREESLPPPPQNDGNQQQQRTEEQQSTTTSSDEETSAAKAIVIQKMYRGFSARKFVKEVLTDAVVSKSLESTQQQQEQNKSEEKKDDDDEL